jgi:site-specific DNA-methyltransferase (adenine-specific)
MQLDVLYNEDCLEGMKRLPDHSIDCIISDLPYGTTNCAWDSVIPFEPLWAQYKRVAKRNAAIVLTASQPFTTALIASNPKDFRYALVWDKAKGGNFALARKQPMKSHEDVLVFYRAQPVYHPQMEVRGRMRKKGGGKPSDNFGIVPSVSYNNQYYPRSILAFSNASRVDHIHPTQKPVALFEYLIRTYTNPGETVLDNCIGSGTTAIAAINTGRHYIGFEKDPQYFQSAQQRIANHQPQLSLIA